MTGSTVAVGAGAWRGRPWAVGGRVTDLAVLGGSLVDTAGGTVAAGDLLVRDGRIVACGRFEVPAGVAWLDARGLLVAPGLIDVQINGAAGVDITAEPGRISAVADALPRHGVTAFLPTVVSSPPATVAAALAALAARAAAAAAGSGGAVAAGAVRAGAAGRAAVTTPGGAVAASGAVGAVPLGLHVEGPMIAPARRGAHPLAQLRAPDLAAVAAWSRDAGVAVVTLAPELPGALPVIEALTARGVTVSIGHTEATYAQVRAAVDAGARMVTHLFNAMPGLSHREPGPVGAALGGDDLVAGVIVDGQHVHPAVVEAAWRALGPDRLLLVSDATAALDLAGDQVTTLGEHRVRARDGVAWLADRPDTMAGAVIGLAECMCRLVAYTGCPPARAIAAASLVPARLLGLTDRGRLAAGARADVVLLRPDLSVAATLVAGRIAYQAED
jgi:N-acetylglucosamine-6-phosphate deacetylase